MDVRTFWRNTFYRLLRFPLVNRTLERGSIEWFIRITTEHYKCKMKLYLV